MSVDNHLFNGKELAIETYKKNVIREIGDQSQDALLRVCQWKEDLNGTGAVWITIMGASKALRRGDKYSMVGFSKGNKTRRVKLQLEEVIAKDLFTDQEKKETNIAFDKEIAKNQADSIKVERNFNIIDSIEDEVTNNTVILVDKSSAGDSYNTLYDDVRTIMTHLVGMGVPIHMVIDRHGWGAIMAEEKFINQDYYGSYLAQNGSVDGMVIQGAKVALCEDIEEDVYGQDSYLDPGVVYFIGENSIALGNRPDVNVKDMWSNYWSAYVLETIAYVGCKVVKPKQIVKLVLPPQDKYAGMGGIAAIATNTAQPEQPTSEELSTFNTKQAELNGYSLEELIAYAGTVNVEGASATTEATRGELEKDILYELYPDTYEQVYGGE